MVTRKVVSCIALETLIILLFASSAWCKPEEGGEEPEGAQETTTAEHTVAPGSCEGGEVNHDFLAHIQEQGCHIIAGDLILRNVDVSRDELDTLNQIEKVNGAVIVEQNTGIEDLSFLNKLVEISNSESEEPALRISENEGFARLGLPSLRSVHSQGEGPFADVKTTIALTDEDRELLNTVTGGKTNIELVGSEEEAGDSALIPSLIGIVVLAVLVAIGVSLFIVVRRIHRKKVEAEMPKRISTSNEGRSSSASNEAQKPSNEARKGGSADV
ncbi:unnamed protein product [Nippostrongylus brasiliensis]|uniref:Recep_L_domain domain-containing protein n=1 Tax=Nippostrongylus brasiliensis TaxID=27835 RepID=A0A0N4Y304_NIPBR|nr:unnamed protein product [Nippostrongylus brasiliensis]